MNDVYMNDNSSLISAQALVCALKYRDRYTQLHSERVASLAVELGKRCGLPSSQLDLLTISANLHDIGKIGIADNILLKPGRFNFAEWQEMKSHSEKSQSIINSLCFIGKDVVAKVVRHHHENFDGSGYPDNLSGEEIPLLSRVITIADNYDALSEKRSYHGSRKHNDVIDIMQGEAQKKFDPEVFRKFLNLMTRAQA